MQFIKFYLTILVSIFIASTAVSQKVEHKKDITSVDGKPLLKVNGGSLVFDNKPAQVVNFNTGKLLFVLTKHYFYYNGSNGYWYNELRFSDVGVIFKSSFDYKALIKSLYENKVLTEAGEIDEDALQKYMFLYPYTPPGGN